MRMIGYISNEPDARAFSDFLYVQGIDNQVEMERGSGWAVWVHSEDEVEKARSSLRDFLLAPSAPKYSQASQEAQKRRQQEAAANTAAAKRTYDSERLFTRPMVLGMTIATAVLVGICVGLWLLSLFPDIRHVLQSAFLISNYHIGNTPLERLRDGLLEIKRGQVWRLVTPILLHDTRLFLHVLFNMLWLKDLGTLFEAKRGSWYLLLFVVVTGAISNLAQYAMGGPRFYGMSGVVYALLGYVWIKGKFDPGSGFFLHPTTVAMMLIWLVIGYTNILPIANGAHTMGLIAGMFWGYISAVRRS